MLIAAFLKASHGNVNVCCNKLEATIIQLFNKFT